MATNRQRREAAKRKLERQLARRAERARRRRNTAIASACVTVLGCGALLAWFFSDAEPDSQLADRTSAAPTPSVPIPTARAPMPARPTPLADPVSCDYQADAKSPAPRKARLPSPVNVRSRGTVDVTLKTSVGDIPLRLDRAMAPCAVNSFLNLVGQDFYTGTTCHRLGTSGLQMLQCGDPSTSGTPDAGDGPGYTIPDETFPQLSYGRGVLAMAKAKAPHSGGSQFFMVYGDAPLDPNFTVLGSISDKGLDVLDTVARAGITPDSLAVSEDGTGAPALPVKITGAAVEK